MLAVASCREYRAKRFLRALNAHHLCDDDSFRQVRARHNSATPLHAHVLVAARGSLDHRPVPRFRFVLTLGPAMARTRALEDTIVRLRCGERGEGKPCILDPRATWNCRVPAENHVQIHWCVPEQSPG